MSNANNKYSLKRSNAPKKDWVIFIVSKVLDRPNRNSYQRIVALAQEFKVIVVTNAKLPSAHTSLVSKVYRVSPGRATFFTVRKIARELKNAQKNVYIHTQYAPNSAIVGYVCSRSIGCKWLYDLWDHPTLSYMKFRGPARWVRQFIWVIAKNWILNKADVWIVAMHPAILGYLPLAPVTCKIIFTRPGWFTDSVDDIIIEDNFSFISQDIIKIVYAGPVALQRNLKAVLSWAVHYQGPVIIDLHIIGACLDNNSKKMINSFKNKSLENPYLALHIYGELQYSDTLKILRSSHIGLCPLDISVLNYRFAYPVKIIEQMYLGLIVIAHATHGTREWITDGKDGILADNSEKGMENALYRAINICQKSEWKFK